ncbi:MAG TPA: histidine kinase, partial [Sphingomonas sp.]
MARLALLAVVVYGALLFGLAHVVQKAGLPARWFRTIHTLSLAVYCSSWTMFGGVGTAVSAGWSYVAIYVGPILVFLFAPRLLDRLMARARRSGSTSIADFVSSCYGRSRGISAIVTIGALVASIPYVALQLRSVSSTFATLAGSHDRGMLGPLVAIVLAVFSISFGARHFSVAGRNDGLIAAIAAESLFKMLSFGALGLYAASLLFLHPAASVAVPPVAAPHAVPWTDIGTRIVLSAFAVICLPRQFYVGVSEARGDASLRSARWGFSAYLAIMVAAVVPLAIAGMRFLPAGADPDLFVLSLPLAQGNQGFALLAFLGGFSAATAMVITEAVALSTMVTNDLVAPLLLDGRRGGGEADLGRLMLTVRRVTILAIIGIALAYGATIGASRSLASIGLIALAGVAQFGPALVASLAFDLRHAAAARAGLVAGLAVWAWTLLLPSFSDGMLADAIAGATGAWLDPRAPFGLDLGSPIATGGLLALGANVAAMLLVRIAAGAPGGEADPSHGFNHVASLAEIEALVARFVGEAEAAECFRELRPAAAGDCDRVPISGQAARIAERSIARVIGAPSARLIVTSTMAGGMLDVGDVVRLLDQNEQNLQFSRTLLAATLEAIDPGVSVVDSNLRLI